MLSQAGQSYSIVGHFLSNFMLSSSNQGFLTLKIFCILRLLFLTSSDAGAQALQNAQVTHPSFSIFERSDRVPQVGQKGMTEVDID